jgi:hypothetical protein
MKIFALLTAAISLLALGACSTCPAKTSAGCCGASGSSYCPVQKKASQSSPQ